jgi:hypothetical protein
MSSLDLLPSNDFAAPEKSLGDAMVAFAAVLDTEVVEANKRGAEPPPPQVLVLMPAGAGRR